MLSFLKNKSPCFFLHVSKKYSLWGYYKYF